MPEFLLEIGCEEMPAPWLPGLMEQLRQRFQEAGERTHLAPREVESLATPRRLVLRADVRERQADREETVWGPSLKVARDPAGHWTSAAQGFARKSGLAADQLQQGLKDPAGQETHLFHVRKTPGLEAREVLPGVMASLLRGLSFPRRMSWDAWLEDGKGSLPFGRPIRWIVALLDGEVVPFAIHALRDGARGEVIVESGRHTRGHRFLPEGGGERPLPVRSFRELKEGLRRAFVLLDPRERELRIGQGLSEAGPGEAGEAEGLLGEWRDLVEYPTVLVGTIPEEFHALPREVLETVLVHHQKYLPLRAGGGVSRFAAVTNTAGANGAEIVRGMERVVVARLRDASFFFREDMKRPLPERVADLGGVTFHQGLGTYLDKTGRLESLVEAMGRDGLLPPEVQAPAREAARLAKADLTTLMVREFPELQGVMGGLYLRAQGGVPEGVSAAVQWHYHPLSVEEGTPPARVLEGAAAKLFAAVSLADKLDTLAGHFVLGNAPTGSSDPYGLRRAAHGVVRVLLDFWSAEAGEPYPSLRRLVGAALAGHLGPLMETAPAAKLKGRSPADVARELEAFFLDRIAHVFRARGFPPDEVDACVYAEDPHGSPVFNPGPQRIQALEDVRDCFMRLNALHRVRVEAREDFDHLAVAFKRARNILEQGLPAPVNAGLFEEEAERELHDAVARLRGVDGGYEARLRSLSALRAPVDRFFDDVLVMAEDPKLRANRLGLLAQALSLFYRIADISKLGG